MQLYIVNYTLYISEVWAFQKLIVPLLREYGRDVFVMRLW